MTRNHAIFLGIQATGYMKFTDMFDMLRRMEPPLGFGKNCPHRVAYRVSAQASCEGHNRGC